MHVIVVESPSKAKTINGYVGSDYIVCASYGHIRDLAPQENSVDPSNDFSMKWVMTDESKKRVQDIINYCKNANSLILATDPDREGEAIAWHVLDSIKKIKELKNIPIFRVVFHEITKKAVLDSLKNPRQLDNFLVEAYLARRALDYLVGYTLSPVLWRKLPGAKSAGRVQSVALRIVCDREQEIECFKPREYWTILGTFLTSTGESLSANLVKVSGDNLDKFSLNSEHVCKEILSNLNKSYALLSLEKKIIKKSSLSPFSTSTLQQEANKKLGFSASRTMQIAQKLYEGIDIGSGQTGLITYMRTDSVSMGVDSIKEVRSYIQREFGDEYLPDSFKKYVTKTKNAQEAHECIRPTQFFYSPDAVKKYLTDDQWALYNLIWKRTISSQMSDAVFERVVARIGDNSTEFRATGSVLKFNGFLKVYCEDEINKDTLLPILFEKEVLTLKNVDSVQHFTKPPARFTEATLIKAMEELGIGRPSTYAPILRVLQDRDYVFLEKGRFIPKDRGRLVVAFLACFFCHYVDYHFTAELEEKLDKIANRELLWKDVLNNFWQDFNQLCCEVLKLTGTLVREKLDQTIGEHFFQIMDGNKDDPRKCPNCLKGRLSLNFGKLGYFISCSCYPECRYTYKPGLLNMHMSHYPKILGNDVSVHLGPYGPYVQKDGKSLKRVAIPKEIDVENISYETAESLLALPRLLGVYPSTGKPIYAGIGKFGSFLRMDKTFIALSDNVLSIDLNTAINLFIAHEEKKKNRILGNYPDTGDVITIERGRFGPYLKMGKIHVSIKDSENISLEDAIEKLNKKVNSDVQKKSVVFKKQSAKTSIASKKKKKIS